MSLCLVQVHCVLSEQTSSSMASRLDVFLIALYHGPILSFSGIRGTLYTFILLDLQRVFSSFLCLCSCPSVSGKKSLQACNPKHESIGPI